MGPVASFREAVSDIWSKTMDELVTLLCNIR